jgi:uncharacterized membrane protein YvbJ
MLKEAKCRKCGNIQNSDLMWCEKCQSEMPTDSTVSHGKSVAKTFEKCLFCEKSLNQGSAHESCLECGMPLTRNKDEAIKLIRETYNQRIKVTAAVFVIFAIISMVVRLSFAIPFGSLLIYGVYAFYLNMQKQKKIYEVDEKLR